MVIAVGALVLAVTAVLVYVAWQTKGQSHLLIKHEIESLRSDFRDSIDKLITQMNNRLRDNTSLLGERLDSANKVVGTVREQLGQLREASTRIFEIGKDISSLQDLLRAPKIRGGLGEYFLEALLAEVFPAKEYYQMQYMFKNGQQVDAVIKFESGIVPIDSKFPLENFKAMLAAPTEEQKKASRRQFVSDVKKHIADIASKYIVPDERTFNFALMYIPAENVYYETIIKEKKSGEGGSIFNYSLSKRVIPVSPNSFYAYLQVILLGMRGMAVEKEAQQILAGISRLKGDFDKFAEEYAKLGKHLVNSRGSFEETERRLLKLQEKILQLNGLRGEKALPYEEKSIV